MTFRQGRFRTWKKPRECLCGHLALVHYKDINGAHTLSCRIVPCACKKYSEAKKPNKYHAVKQEFNGERYDSKFEARVAADLDYQLRAGKIAEIRRQVEFPFVINGRRLGRFVYRADFVVRHLDGSEEIVEAKGFQTDTFRLKWALVEALYPDVKLTLRTQ